MKYGDTLRQRSIPEWAHYNIDYDYLKDLIKDQTTPGSGKALSIPGQGDTIEREFTQSFFQVLREQHTRINCFVKSKSGEIESRLDYIGKRLSQLRAKSNAGPGTRLPARIVEQYAKIDADVTRAGEEIRSLARFRTAQRTGFHKILKKYKRWTKDSELEHRFNQEICRDPDSFFQLDLGNLLDQYIDVLGAVRAPLDHSGPLHSLPHSSTGSAARLAHATEAGTEVEFDVALSTVPIGHRGSTASYWIHVDHIVEVQVLLLQQLRLHVSKHGSSAATSPYATPARRKSSATVDKYFGNEDDVGMIILDQLESFVPKQNASTVNANEESSCKARGGQATGYVRWTSASEASVIVQGVEGSKGWRAAKLKRKLIESFLDTSSSFNERQETESEERHSKEEEKGASTVRQWLADHREIEPMVGVCSKRTRFVGLQNSPAGGMWATLDRDIAMKESIQHDLRSSEWPTEAREGADRFAHAVLEIRREGGYAESLIQQLDSSHLVQRVHGYSLEAHAVWTCRQPSSMSPPVWSSLLDQDIRKVPMPVKRKRRRQANGAASLTTDSRSNTSRPDTSPSATSLTDGQSTPFASRNEETPATSASELINPPPLQAFRKKHRRPFAEDPEPVQADPVQPKQGYWNEYDNPESEDEGYYIYIDPNAPSTFPGAELFESIARKTKQLLGFGPQPHERSPLLGPGEYGSSDDGFESGDETVSSGTRNYGTVPSTNRQQGHQQQEGYFSSLFRSFRNPQRDAQTLDTMQRQSLLERQNLLATIHLRQRQGEMAKLQTYCSCLAAGIVLDVVLAVMAKTSRRKLRGEVDVAIILGVLCNLMLLLTAVVSVQTRHDRLGWLHQGSVYTVVVAMVVVDVLLFRWALNL